MNKKNLLCKAQPGVHFIIAKLQHLNEAFKMSKISKSSQKRAIKPAKPSEMELKEAYILAIRAVHIHRAKFFQLEAQAKRDQLVASHCQNVGHYQLIVEF